MSNTWAQELTACSEDASRLATEGKVPQFEGHLSRLEMAADRVAEAWSGSNLGYQACVYYVGFSRPPAGAHFSREWGFMGMFQGTTGDWKEMDREEIRGHILALAGNPDLAALEEKAEEAHKAFGRLKERAISVISAYLQGREDDYAVDVKAKIVNLRISTWDEFVRVQMRAPNAVTRDMRAADGGWQSAPHQEVLAQVAACRMPFKTALELAELCANVAEHMSRAPVEPPLVPVSQMGTKVFIGHGGSLQWRVLKDFLQDTLRLPWDEFNRVPIAGITNINRLQEMLDNASVAFLVLTAEDEQADGSVVARQNVVHEAGLFQGRLGFNRAIIMLEEGCEEFSNINGLGEIRFPAGQIEARFEEVRQVLIREGLLRES
jgi:Predicted nucleotide-binding protein containing TIR-like domain